MLKHCYYINLERRVDRKEYIEKELNKSKLLKNIYRRFDAIDGNKIHPRTIDPTLLTENAISDILMDTVTAWGLSLTQGGLGVLLSYINLFKKISELDSPTITFEDDVELIENFDQYLTQILKELPLDFDICYLGHGDNNFDKETYSDNLVIPNGVVTCLPSLIISPKGAKKLLEILKNVDHQIDTVLYKNFNKLNVFISKTRIVNIKNSFTTDIQGNNNCKKTYQKQNYIFSTLAIGENANNNALKLCHDLNYFKQDILIVTDRPELYNKLSNVKIVSYPYNIFSYNHKILCFTEGFKLMDSVVYLDSDTRIFYKDYKTTYTNFFRIINPGFHPSWDWGKINRQDSGFFNSQDVKSRVQGYGELAYELCEKLNIDINNAYHYQEGFLIISKDDGKEKILLDTWYEMSSILDKHEITNNSERIGVGEGNLLGLSISKSGIKVNTTEISNLLGSDLKYNFCSGGQISDYIINYPDRKTVKVGDGKLIKTNKLYVSFKDKKIDLTYSIYEISDNLMILSFDWNLNNNIEFLDHEFKVNDTVYHFNSEKSNEFIFEKKENLKIQHTFDWYGERNWVFIDEL